MLVLLKKMGPTLLGYFCTTVPLIMLYHPNGRGSRNARADDGNDHTS